MKVRPSVKPMCEKCKIIRRKGQTVSVGLHVTDGRSEAFGRNIFFRFKRTDPVDVERIVFLEAHRTEILAHVRHLAHADIFHQIPIIHIAFGFRVSQIQGKSRSYTAWFLQEVKHIYRDVRIRSLAFDSLITTHSGV